MRITIPRPDGDIVIEVDNNDEIPAAARIINAIRLKPPTDDYSALERADYEKVAEYVRGANVSVGIPQEWVGAPEMVKPNGLLSKARTLTSLSPALEEVHSYLLDNDSDEGVNPGVLAEAFGINRPAMEQRLRQLKKRGFVQQESRGMWRVA